MLTFFAALAIAVAAMAQTGASMQVSEETFNFGQIPQGTPVTHQFTVTNTGDEPLVIQNVQKVCGCTVTEWTKSPIMPGQSGTVSAQYNAASMGKFKKPITVIANATNSPMKLYFEGEVVAKEQLSGAPMNQGIMNGGN